MTDCFDFLGGRPPLIVIAGGIFDQVVALMNRNRPPLMQWRDPSTIPPSKYNVESIPSTLIVLSVSMGGEVLVRVGLPG